MLETRLLFPIPLWKGHFDGGDEFFSSCINFSLEQANKTEGRKLTNVGGWQSEAVSMQKIKISPFQPFFDHLFKATKEIEKDLGTDFTFVLNNAWVNVNFQNCYNTKHVHPRASMSGVLYLTEKNSPITFYNDNPLNEWNLKHYDASVESPLVRPNYTLTPARGDFLLFYPWLPHSVATNDTPEPRISIAFNLGIE
jgi:uncharacterized protein (TIGR02466 family)